jgi:hypothetical protein
MAAARKTINAAPVNLTCAWSAVLKIEISYDRRGLYQFKDTLDNFVQQPPLICPSCQWVAVDLARKSVAESALSRSRKEGRFAVVTDVGSGMRWTRAVRETNAPNVDGEVVWS